MQANPTTTLSIALSTAVRKLRNLLNSIPQQHHFQLVQRFSVSFPEVELSIHKGFLIDKTGLAIKHLSSQFLDVTMTQCHLAVKMQSQEAGFEIFLEMGFHVGGSEKITVALRELEKVGGEDVMAIIGRAIPAGQQEQGKRKKVDDDEVQKEIRKARDVGVGKIDANALKACLHIMGIDQQIAEKVLEEQSSSIKPTNKIDISQYFKPRDNSQHIFQQIEQKKLKQVDQNQRQTIELDKLEDQDQQDS